MESSNGDLHNPTPPSKWNGGLPLLRKVPPWMKWVGLLALALCLAGAGSTSLFAIGNAPVGRGATPKNRSTRVPPPPTRQVHPTPTVRATPHLPQRLNGQIGTLPPIWVASGRGDGEFIEAKDVAETFVSHYELLDWRSRNTFDQATFSMTQAALYQRFYVSDKRANQTYIAGFIQGHRILSPSINSDATRILRAMNGTNSLFVWISVSYNIFHQQDSTPSFTDHHAIVVLLVSTPFGINSVVGGVGWMVSDWHEGASIFPLPEQP